MCKGPELTVRNRKRTVWRGWGAWGAPSGRPRDICGLEHEGSEVPSGAWSAPGKHLIPAPAQAAYS